MRSIYTVVKENDIPLSEYIKEKIRMLDKDFFVHPTSEDIKHFHELKSEIAVDNFAMQLIFDRM